MTPEAKQTYLDSLQYPDLDPLTAQLTQMGWRGLTVRDGLVSMIKAGMRRIAKGEYDGLRFDCFNEAEAEFVATYMEEHHPGVPFWMTRAL